MVGHAVAEQDRRTLSFDIAEVGPMLGVSDQRGQFRREVACHLRRIDQPLQFERLQPAQAITDDDASTRCGAGVAAAAVKSGSEEDQSIARYDERNDRLLFGEDGGVLVELASSPQASAAVCPRERRQRPHHIDEILEATLRSLPHILVTVRQLRQRTGMNFDCLGQVERDALAPGQQHLPDDLEDLRMHRQPLDRRRPREQRTEALGPFPVEGALAQGRRCEARIEIRFDPRDQARLDRATEHAPAVARERRGVGIDRGAHAGTRSSTGE